VIKLTMSDGESSNEDDMMPEASYAGLLEKLDIDMRLRKAVARMGIIRPTPVQEKCLTLAIEMGRDIVAKARTGSGKTLAYLIPVCQKILKKESNYNVDDGDNVGVEAIILVPTKELVTQVHGVVQQLTYYCHEAVTSLKIDGQMSRKQEAALLRDIPKIIISTPAGLLRHVAKNTKVVDLKSSVESLVIDEADLILSFGYTKDVTALVKYLPKICQGFLMSATLSTELDQLKQIVLHSPAVIKLEDVSDKKKKQIGKLMQFYLSLPEKDKYLCIFVFLKLGLLKGKGLFFVNSVNSAYKLKLFLEQFHISSAVLNAELPLQSRMSIIEGFNAGNFDYLVATDESMQDQKKVKNKGYEGDEEDIVDESECSRQRKKEEKTKNNHDSEYGVSRGLDFRGVSFVLNVDFPTSPESYTHRIGRTARGGARGVALSLIDAGSYEQMTLLSQVQESQPKLPIPVSSTELSAVTTTSSEDAIANVGQCQPSPLQFDLKEIEGFRYRVEDVGRAVTKVAVRETRTAELRAEILNSERLKRHFEENPQDLQLLRHDRRATHISKVKDHLKNVPKYLLPRGMQVADLNRKKKRRRVRSSNTPSQRTENDPLQSFDGNVDLEGVAIATDDEDVFSKSSDLKSKAKKYEVSRMYIDTSETGVSSSGRKEWKMRHKKKLRKKTNLHERS